MSGSDSHPGAFRPAGQHASRRAYWALSRRMRDERVRPRPLMRNTPQPVALPGDDVEVGFPLASTFVPSMRKVFFSTGEDDDCAMQQTEIALTARQATEGAQVSLDLTLRHTCPVCGGRGELWSDPCGVCVGSGTGWVSHQLEVLVPPGVRNGSCLRFSISPPYAAETNIEVCIAVQ